MAEKLSDKIDRYKIPIEYAQNISDMLYMKVQGWLEENDAPEDVRHALMMISYWDYHVATNGGLVRNFEKEDIAWDRRYLVFSLNLLERAHLI